MYTANAYGTLTSNQHDPTSANSITSRDKQQEVWAGPKEKYAVLGDKHGKNCQQQQQYLLLHWRNLLPPLEEYTLSATPIAVFFQLTTAESFPFLICLFFIFVPKLAFNATVNVCYQLWIPLKKNLHAYETVSPSFVQWLLSSHEPFAVSILYYLLTNLNISFILFSHRITCISVLLNFSYLGSDFYLKALL